MKNFKGFLIGFLSVWLLALPLMLTSCNTLKDSTQQNTTNNTVTTGDFDIL